MNNPAHRRGTPRIAALLVVAFALTGCTSTPGPSSPPSSPEPSVTETPPPVLVPEGTAQDNLPFFAMVVDEVWAGEDRAKGRAYIDALIEAGFDREAMQLTPDRSTVGRPAESFQFSVAWDADECLIGQVGPSTGDPVVTVMPQLALDRCLVGNTVAIDW